MRGECVIAGVGHTSYGKHPGRSTVSLNIEACQRAIADAGIEKELVDAVFVKYPTSQPEFLYANKVCEALGLQPLISGVWDQGGASNITMISYAVMAIAAGQCSVALITGADNPRTGTRQAYERGWGDDAVFGWFGIPAGYAMIANRHMHEYGTTSEQLGAVAVAARRHGKANPHAQLREPLTLQQHQDSPWLVEPLRAADCCLVSDAGGAVLVTSTRRARELGVREAVSILGFGQGQTPWDVAQRPTLTTTAASQSARVAFEMAGMRPADIDVAQIYDCFTITVLMTLEDYGFCPKGQAGPFAASGAMALDGALPANTSGGLLSETGMPGMQLVIEGVRQMRGRSPSQVPHAQSCIVSGQGGIMHTHATLILGQP
jgi:acetyl-CoA acetyltransferase